MQLREWLDRQGRGATAKLAREIGCERWATVHEIANGHVPKPARAKAIEEATDGEVTAAEVLGLIGTTKRRRRNMNGRAAAVRR